MKRIYQLQTPGTKAERAIDTVLNVVASQHARNTALPGAVVIERYPGGQPKTYEYDGRTLTRRQYTAIIKELDRMHGKPDPDVNRVVVSVLDAPKKQQTALPGVEIVDHYPTGQAKTYRYRGRLLSRRQYMATVKALKAKGVLIPKAS